MILIPIVKKVSFSFQYYNRGRFKCISISASNIRAMRRSLCSVKAGVMICKAAGRWSAFRPQGMLMAGRPTRLAGMV